MKKMKMTKIGMFFVGLLLFGACHHKLTSKTNSSNIQKMEVLAYYQSSGKLGYKVESVKIDGDKLIFNIIHNGGCKPHTFRLIGDSTILKSKPIQTNLYLVHENNDDICADEIKKELIFDISRLKNMGHNPIQINIDHLNTLLYEYK
jgi:hypothetical protein